MANDDSDESKEFEPSQRKLDEARKSGDVPRSTDLTAAAAQGGFLIALFGAGAWSITSLGTLLESLLSGATRLGDEIPRGGAQALAGHLLAGVAVPMAPWFAIPAAAAVAALVVQQAIAISSEKLEPKLSRINPLSNAKQKFGLTGLVEFGKSAVKLGLISTCLAFFLLGRMPMILQSVELPAQRGLGLMINTLVDFLAVALAIAAAIGILDFFWQRFNHRRKLMMSRKELLDEMKHNEGDPHMKQQRRQRGYDIATNQMLQDVPGADVVIVNPEHYAVALKWERKPGSAPICVAKGVDEIAARIREAANAAGVPIHRDPPTARALHATVEIGREIRPEHYQTVAVAIRFAEEMRARARRSWK